VQTVAQTFIRKTDRIYTLVYDTGTKLQTTATHPFYIEGKGWVKAADLHIGEDSLLAGEVSPLDVYGGARLQNVSYRQSKQGVIVGITVEDRAETVYNFEVNETHTYLVGDAEVVVHNAGYAAEAPDAAAQNIYDSRADAVLKSNDGFFSMLWNKVRYGKYQPDEIAYYADNIQLISTDPKEQAKMVALLNDLAGKGIKFEVDSEGRLIVKETGNISDERPKAADLLRDILKDKDFQLDLVLRDRPLIDKETNPIGYKKDLEERGSATLRTWQNPNSATIILDPKADKEREVWYENKDGTRFRAPGDDLTITLGHELIHADHYRRGVEDFNETHIDTYDADGNLGFASRSFEEIVTTGLASPWPWGRSGIELADVGLPGVSWGKQLLLSLTSGISENDLREERNKPLRITYAPVDATKGVVYPKHITDEAN
jgi:hypothetical protein